MKKTTLLLLLAFLTFGFTGKKDKGAFPLDENTVMIEQGKYLARTEVSNYQYKEFLMHLISSGQADLVPAYAPDVTVWDQPHVFKNPYTQYYLSHPAFDNYPVVGVSHEAALAFCAWLTEKYVALAKDGNKVDASFEYKFRLPTQEEWELAAQGDAEGPGVYPGGWYYPRDHKGRFVFNHKLGNGDFAGWAGGNGQDFEGYMITAPVTSMYKDELDLYHLTGNVAEMVMEKGIAKGGSWAHEAKDCKIGVNLEYEAPNSWLGFRYIVEVPVRNVN